MRKRSARKGKQRLPLPWWKVLENADPDWTSAQMASPIRRFIIEAGYQAKRSDIAAIGANVLFHQVFCKMRNRDVLGVIASCRALGIRVTPRPPVQLVMNFVTAST